MTRALAVDLGGTHVRFRLLDAGSRTTPVEVVEAGEVASFEDAFGHWRQRSGASGRLDAIGIAAAGPVSGDRAHVTNLDWLLDARAIERDCGARHCLLINDVAAIAWALPLLSGSSLRTLVADDSDPDTGETGRESRADKPRRTAVRAVIAPGTGLGVSAFVPTGSGNFAVIEGEGGHRTLAAQSPREWAVVSALADRFGHASAERALSGPGIEAIWRALVDIDGLRRDHDKPAAEIAVDAHAGADPIAEETVSMFTAFLGSVAGDVALTLGARGGMYIAGGIVPGWRERFDAASFVERFRAKGRLRDYLRTIPVHVVTHPYPGLLGVESLLAHRLDRPHARGAARTRAAPGSTR